jgi:hypothetical protein
MALWIWTDEAGLVRRIRTRTQIELITVDFLSFGPEPTIDWSRLP